GTPVICVAGDGSVQMNIQELATIYKHQLPIFIAITNNGVLGMVRQWQEMFHSQRYSEIFLADSNPDFARLAEAYGIEGHNVFSREEARELIPKVLESGKPTLVNFVVYESEKVFPMIPAGAGGNHREHLFTFVHDEVHEGRLPGFEHFGNEFAGFFPAEHVVPFNAVRFRESGEVGVRVRQENFGVPLRVEHFLPLAHHAEHAVVGDGDEDRQLVFVDGGEFLDVHLDGTVAGHADDGRA